MKLLYKFSFLVLLSLNFSSYSNGESSDVWQSLIKPHRVWCLNDQFTCSSKQCIDKIYLCDGVDDCDNGSDEDPELCKSLNPRSCTLPKDEDDKSYAINCNENNRGYSGEYLPEYSLLSFMCKPGYTRDKGSSFQSFCLNSTWTPAIPSCSKSCILPHVPDMKYTCFRKGKEVLCDGEMITGTKVQLHCKHPFYHPPQQEAVCLDNGEWSVKHFQCEADCGIYSDETSEILKFKEFPWHVVIRRKNHDNNSAYYVFAGTLITPNLVLTVARSAVDGGDQKLPVTDFEVIVNNTLDDEYQTIYKVKEIFFTDNGYHSKYNIVEETDDIAIFLLTESVELSRTVLPVCVVWNGWTVTHSGPPNGRIVRMGTVVKSDKPNKSEIDTIRISIHDLNTCVGMVPGNVIQQDQFCGKLIEPKTTGDSDYGVALCSRHEDTLHYLKGVLRVTYVDSDVKVFTDAGKHLDWINTIRHKVENGIETISKTNNISIDVRKAVKSDLAIMEDDSLILHTDHPPLSYGPLLIGCSGDVDVKFVGGCKLPFANLSNFEYKVKCPDNLQGTLQTYCKHASEGDYVPEYSALTSRCKCGFASLHNSEETSVCFNGEWRPSFVKCNQTCRKLKLHNLSAKCSYDGKEIECKPDLITGTRVTLDCLPGYAPESPPKQRDFLCDEDGEWNGIPYRCIPVCGRPSINNTIANGDGRDALVGEFPWNVAIYDKTKDNELICSGTILTESTILTAAHCFYDPVHKVKRHPKDFVLRVSKVSRDLGIKDSPKTQSYEVEQIVFKNYYDELWKYFNDIAILKLKHKIIYNSEVFPVCLQHDKPIPTDRLLYTSGWGNYDSQSINSVLRVAELQHLNLTECMAKAPITAKEYILEDKSCLYGNSHNFANSGSGVFHYDIISSSYHIVGVVSHKVPDFTSATVYTNVNYHVHWIRSIHATPQKIRL